MLLFSLSLSTLSSSFFSIRCELLNTLHFTFETSVVWLWLSLAEIALPFFRTLLVSQLQVFLISISRYQPSYHSSLRNLPLHQVRVEGQRFEWATTDLGTSLRNEAPGDRSVCMCRDGDPDNATHQIATLVLAGPERDNTASCFKSQQNCGFQLREIATSSGRNHLRVMPSCDDYALTPPGFAAGAFAVASETSFWYELNDTYAMRIEDAGIYKLCWCHAVLPSDCSQLSHFNVEAGSFIYAGPYFVSPREARVSQVGCIPK